VSQLPLDATTAPHVHRGTSTAKAMWSVTLALLPAAAWGVFSFGVPALRTLLAAALAAAATELVISSLLKRRSLQDGSALLTGLLVGLTLPPAVPIALPIVGGVFAVAVAKWAFGGLGANWANPALCGHLFVFLSWRDLMGHWTAPRLWGLADGVSSATPLGFAASLGAAGASLLPAGYPVSGLDRAFVALANKILGAAGPFPSGLVDLLLGNRPGAIGEVSVLLLAAGGIYLISRRIVAWEIPASYLVTVALLAWVLGAKGVRLGHFHASVTLELLGGGLLFGALYMASDPVTSPLTPAGMLLFGVGCGCLTYLIRALGTYTEGVAFAIVLMNALVPLIGRLTERRGRRGGGR
jgi:electron transport complex protein RnfD